MSDDVLTQLRLGVLAAVSGKTRGWDATFKVTECRFRAKIRLKMAFSGTILYFEPLFCHFEVPGPKLLESTVKIGSKKRPEGFSTCI